MKTLDKSANPKMILLIDNYDSFSYNLAQMIGTILIRNNSNTMIRIIRNDELSTDEITNLEPDYIIISPGPGRPKDAGVCEEVIVRLGKSIPILGICLGHQAICEAFGGVITYADSLFHGKQSQISINTNEFLFKGVPDITPAARYHSLIAEKGSLPEMLKVIARSIDDEIMAVRHKDYNIFGLQFHPESILTGYGEKMIENFLSLETI